MIRSGLIAAAMLACGAAGAQERGAPPLGEDAQALDHAANEQTPERWERPRANTQDLIALFTNYPNAARRARIEGNVTMTLCVSSKGKPRDVQLLRSSGSDVLDRASTDGILHVRFKPGENQEGQPVDWCDPPYVITLSWRLPR
jgi:TonB family protein